MSGKNPSKSRKSPKTKPMDRTKSDTAGKKQGGGGKGIWTLEEEIRMQTEEMPKLDLNDPNYDSDDDYDDRAVVFVSEREYQNSPAAIKEQNAMPLSDYKKKCTSLIKEFFVAKNFEETKESVNDLGCPSFHFDFVKRIISMSLDQNDKEREAVSQLISFMYRDVLAMGQIGKGFERLLESIDDLALDVPLARQMLAQFLARALADEVIPPSFVMDPVVQQIGGDVVNHAQRMLSATHGVARMEKVWGPGDGRPVPELKEAVDMLMQEYLLSKDLDEATRCVRELKSPHFHHEVVKRAIVNSLDKSPEDHEAMRRLLSHLSTEEIISKQQIMAGMKRVCEVAPDLTLDTPNAGQIIEEFVSKLHESGVIESTEGLVAK